MKNRLRVLRAELNWSQAELAERLGVSRQTVNAIETGKYDPSLPLAFSLARTFKRRIEEIFEHVKKELMRCGYYDGLAAGLVLTGGATAMDGDMLLLSSRMVSTTRAR